MSYKIIYQNIGRKRASGEVIVKDLKFETLNKLFRPFFIQDIEIEVNKKTGEGRIIYDRYMQPFNFCRSSRKAEL